MTSLAPYDQARIMLAEAKTVDDVKDIMDKAAAMAEYRRRAGDRTLEVDAIEIRMFAERRLGQMIAAQKATVGLNKGQLRRGAAEEPRDERPTLAESGIDKKLSARAQKMAAMAPAAFESKLATWRAEALVEDRVVTNLLHVGQKEEQAANRRNLASGLADTSDQLLTGRVVPCVYIDPAFARKAGIGDRAYENHYPTEKWDSILDIMRKARGRLQPNAWAFIWIPRAHMLALHPCEYEIIIDDGTKHTATIRIPLIWAIARALGCTDYSTCFVWTKTDEEHPDEHGTFLIARDQDEILCLYKKGDGLPRPASEHIYGSNHRERSRPLGHSVKPPFYRKMIVDMIGRDSAGKPLPVLEMFCRHDEDNPLPENWESWGNESNSVSDGALSSSLPSGESEPAVTLVLAPSGNTSDAPGSRVAQNPHDPTALSLQQGLDTSSNPGTAARPQGEGSVAASVANPEEQPDVPDGSPVPPSASETDPDPDPDHDRWEDEGGNGFADDDLVVVKPLRRVGAA